MRFQSKTKKTKSYRAGILAEYYAAAFLFINGYHIKKIRYKTRVGEIDLIAQRGKVIVFVEVKYRKDITDALNAISPQSMGRIRRAGEHYLLGLNNESHIIDPVCRFDVIAIRKNFLIRHIKNAF